MEIGQSIAERGERMRAGGRAGRLPRIDRPAQAYA